MMLKNQKKDDFEKMRSEAMASLKRVYDIETEEERKERHRRFIESLKVHHLENG
jgi:hypothetical protein